MRMLIQKLLGIRPEDQYKTFLLYLLHMFLYIGIIWGVNACTALFLANWDSSYLGFMFLGDAALIFVMGLFYAYLANKFDNERLLLIILGAMSIWLISVWIMLKIPALNGKQGFVYPYFYILLDAFRDMLTIHTLTYINEFFDTRTAKRTVPVMVSASIMGTIVAGALSKPLVNLIQLDQMPLAWLATILLAGLIVFVIRTTLKDDLEIIERARAGLRRKTGLGALLTGWSAIREMPILTWLAVSSFVMIVLMSLLNYQANSYFGELFKGDRNAINAFLADLSLYSSLVVLPIQLFAFGRIVSWLGVGMMSLFFPLLSFFAITFLNLSRGPVSASAGEIDRSLIRRAFNSSVETMLYNSVPVQKKTQARGFVTGFIYPLGMLSAGAVVLTFKYGSLPPIAGQIVGIGLGLAFLTAAFRVRAEYGRALSELLSQSEMALFQIGQDQFEQVDPAMLALVERRIDEAQSDATIVFLADLLYRLQGLEALPRLKELTLKHGPMVYVAILEFVQSEVDHPDVRQFVLDGLQHENKLIRATALDVIQNIPNKVWPLMERMAQVEPLLGDDDLEIQENVVSMLMVSGQPASTDLAREKCLAWLQSTSPDVRQAGLRGLAHLPEAGALERLQPYFRDSVAEVRMEAARAASRLAQAAQPRDENFLKELGALLKDPFPETRMVAIDALGAFSALNLLEQALGDPSIWVRMQACKAVSTLSEKELHPWLESPNPLILESATLLLSASNPIRARKMALEQMESLLIDIYDLKTRVAAIQKLSGSGTQMLISIFSEHANELVERYFWLLSVLSNEETAERIQRSLSSPDAVLRANAIETLEALTNPRMARIVMLFFDSSAPITSLQPLIDFRPLSPKEIFEQAWPQLTLHEAPPAIRPAHEPIFAEGWLRAVVIFVLQAWTPPNRRQICADADFLAALQATYDDPSPHVRDTVKLALDRLKAASQENNQMLTPIEKIIFLKEVPFFESMTINQLRVLAGISSEISYAQGETVIKEGDYGDSLYVIVSGAASIQRKSPKGGAPIRLAMLSGREYFGELAIFGGEPHSADVVAAEPITVLRISRNTLLTMIRSQPELVLGLFKVLSKRLRKANSVILAARQNA